MTEARRPGLFLGLALLACLAPLSTLSSLRDHAWWTMMFGLLAFIPYSVAVYFVFSGGGRWRVLIAVGVLARLLLLIPDEGLSDDVYRYLWEGRVLVVGENPYVHPPDDPALEHLRDDVVWPRVTHREVPAAYPPLTQALFALCALLVPTAGGMRVIMVLLDLMVWLVLARYLRFKGIDPRRSVVWGWCPLVLLEVAPAAHFDVLAILLTVAAWLAFAHGSRRRAVVLLALATLSKPYALILLPFLLTGRRFVSQILVFALVLVLGYLPFSLDGSPLTGLMTYSRHWSHNSVLYPAVLRVAEATKTGSAHLLEKLEFGEGMRGLVYGVDPNVLARLVLLAIFVVVVLILWRRREAAVNRACAALAAFLLLAPTVHPWYLMWFLPFLAVSMSPPLLLWCGSVLLSYQVLPDYDRLGVWRQEPLYLIAEYAPVLLWLAWRAWRRGQLDAVAGRRSGPSSDAMPTQ